MLSLLELSLTGGVFILAVVVVRALAMNRLAPAGLSSALGRGPGPPASPLLHSLPHQPLLRRRTSGRGLPPGGHRHRRRHRCGGGRSAGGGHPLDGPALGRGRSGLCPVLPAPPPAGPQGVECLSAGGGPLCHRLAGRPSHPPEGTGALLRPGGQPPHLRSAPPRHPPAQNAGPERRVPAGLRAHPRDGPHTPV